MSIPRGVRRKLRRGLGSRTSRRSGVKSRLVSKAKRPARPAALLRRAIKEWKVENAY